MKLLERVGSDIKRLYSHIFFTKKSIGYEVIEIQGRSMSDPTISDIDLKMVWVWTTLKLITKNRHTQWKRFYGILKIQIKKRFELDIWSKNDIIRFRGVIRINYSSSNSSHRKCDNWIFDFEKENFSSIIADSSLNKIFCILETSFYFGNISFSMRS